jgi:hypothetical protein
MLENWAILTSKYVDHLRPLNIPWHASHVFRRFAETRAQQASKSAHNSNNHAEHAVALGASFDADLKAKIPGAASCSSFRLEGKLADVPRSMIPGRETFEVSLDADDSLITGDSDKRRVDLLMEKVEAHLAGH